MIRDEWIDGRRLISPELAHAVGWIMLSFNLIEDSLRALLTTYSGMNEKDAAHFTYSMDPARMGDVLRSLLAYKESDPVTLEHIQYGIEIANRCRINRNIIAHSWTNFRGSKLFKQSGGNRPLTSVYDFNLSDIRRVADEILECGHYLMYLGLYIDDRESPDPRQALPEKPALPQNMQSIDQYGPEWPVRPPAASPE